MAVGVGARGVLDDTDTTGTGALLGSGEAAAVVMRPTADGARTADTAMVPVASITLAVPAGMTVVSVAVVDEAGAALAVAGPTDGVVRFDGVAAGTYRLVYQAETAVEAGAGGIEIAAATVQVHGPVVVDAAGSVVVTTG